MKHQTNNSSKNLKFGAHLSIAGGYTNPLNKIAAIGGNCLQIFSASPRSWNFAKPTEADIKAFVDLKKTLHVDPVYFHASYLLNLGSDGRTGDISRNLLTHELKLAVTMQVKGSIIHLGSFKNGDEEVTQDKFDILIQNIAKILEKAPSDRLFIIENAGNRKIGKSLEEIAKIIKTVADDRVRVCLDTCHLHAAGYDLTTPQNLDNFLSLFDETIELRKLEVWHLNDSKDPFGSSRDRHENLGKGTVGLDTFRNIVNHAKLKDKPFIIETPGFDDKGPDKANLDIIKKLIN